MGNRDFAFSLLAADNYALAAGGDSAKLRITDPLTRVSITGAPEVVGEGGGINFALRHDGNPNGPLPVIVEVAGRGITSLTRTSHHIPSGSSSMDFAAQLSAFDDNISTPDGEVTLTIVDGANYQPGTPAYASLVVVDGERIGVTTGPPLVTVEEGGVATFTLTADHPAPGDTANSILVAARASATFAIMNDDGRGVNIVGSALTVAEAGARPPAPWF